MCYSTEASLTAWVISVAIAGYLYKRNRNYDRWNAAFIIAFSTIQLWEAGIWSSTDPQTRAMYVKLILVTLAVQPLVQTIGARAYLDEYKILLDGLIVVYSLILIAALYSAATGRFTVDVGPNGHLVWGSNTMSVPIAPIIYLIGLYAGLMIGALINPALTLPLIAVGVITMLWAAKQATPREFSSYWCYVAVLYSIACIIV